MTHKLQVKEHLRNSALYQSGAETSPSVGWKRRLFYRHSLNQQLGAALHERPRLFRRYICIGVPALAIAFAFAAYLGYIHPDFWFENIGRIVEVDIPPIGLKESLIFIALINGWTFFLLKKRSTL